MKLIRHATEKDKNEVFALYTSLLGTPGCTWNTEYPSIEDVELDISQDSLYVMCLNDRIIAAAAAVEDDELDELTCWSPSIRRSCDLSRVGVLSEYQNQGLAKELIRHIEAEAIKKGYDGIHFLVSKTNPAALAAYSRLGYQACGETFMYDTDWWCYEKALCS